jgi:Tol biopolymer transport system component
VRLQETLLVQGPATWSPDGSRLVYHEVTPTTRWDLWALNVPNGKPEQILVTPALEGFARVSPNGRWLAYQSTETGKYEVFIRPFQGPGGRVQISPSGGSDASWSPDGRALYYVKDHAVIRHDIDPMTGTTNPRAETLFKRPEMVVVTPLPDGTFLVADRIREHLPITTMNLVVNWRSEIAR